MDADKQHFMFPLCKMYIVLICTIYMFIYIFFFLVIPTCSVLSSWMPEVFGRLPVSPPLNAVLLSLNQKLVVQNTERRSILLSLKSFPILSRVHSSLSAVSMRDSLSCSVAAWSVAKAATSGSMVTFQAIGHCLMHCLICESNAWICSNERGQTTKGLNADKKHRLGGLHPWHSQSLQPSSPRCSNLKWNGSMPWQQSGTSTTDQQGSWKIHDCWWECLHGCWSACQWASCGLVVTILHQTPTALTLAALWPTSTTRDEWMKDKGTSVGGAPIWQQQWLLLCEHTLPLRMGTFHPQEVKLSTNVSTTKRTRSQRTLKRMTDDTAKHDSFQRCSSSTCSWLRSVSECRSWSRDLSQPPLSLNLAFHCQLSFSHVVSCWPWWLAVKGFSNDLK